MRNHRERGERSQRSVRRRAGQVLRPGGRDEASLEQAMELVARTDDKGEQLRMCWKKWEVSAWDVRAGRRREAVESRRLRRVEVEEQKIAGLDRDRVAAFEILPASAVFH